VSATNAERCRERAPELPDGAAQVDQPLDVVVFPLATHGVNVELFQLLLDALKRLRVGAKHPLQQRGEKAGTIERPGVARPGDT